MGFITACTKKTCLAFENIHLQHRKKKECKENRTWGTCGTLSTYNRHVIGVPEGAGQENETKVNTGKHNGQEISKSFGRHKLRDLRNSMNPKQTE